MIMVLDMLDVITHSDHLMSALKIYYEKLQHVGKGRYTVEEP